MNQDNNNIKQDNKDNINQDNNDIKIYIDELKEFYNNLNNNLFKILNIFI